MRELTTSQAINEALAEELERDPRVFLIGRASCRERVYLCV